MLWIISAIIISAGCWFVLDWAHNSLFTYLGQAEISAGHWENCYTYDLMTWPARIVTFLCGICAELIFILTWLNVYDILFL